MKLTYERPVMRAEQFQTNAYCGDCNWKLTGTEVLKNAIMKAQVDTNKWQYDRELGEWISVPDQIYYTFYFDAGSQQDNNNDGTGDWQHFFHEHAEYKDSTANGLSNGATIHEGGTSTYYLEWSAPNKAFYVYQEMGESTGYYKDGSMVQSGANSLQVNGDSGENGGYNTYHGPENYDKYWADKNTLFRNDATVTYLDGSKPIFGFSG